MVLDFAKALIPVCLAIVLAVPASAAPAASRRAAVVRAGLPGEDPALIEAVSKEINAAGYSVEQLDAVGLCSNSTLNTANFGLLVLPDSAILPAQSAASIDAYVREGGDIIALRTPMWQRAVIDVDGRWLTQEDRHRATPGLGEPVTSFNPPALDTLSPGYKLFDVTCAASLAARDDQVVVRQADLPMPGTIRSPQPRPQGGGFGKERAWRWIPLVEARNAGGGWCGAPVTLTVHADGPYKGGTWASFGVQDVGWYRSPGALGLIRQTAERMRSGVFMVDGGASHYTYFADQDMKLGIRLANLGSEAASGLTARVTLVSVNTGTRAVRREWLIDLPAGEEKTLSGSWSPDSWPRDGFLVTAEILQDGRIIDRVTHEAHVWRPKKEKQFITIGQDGDFHLNGKRWRAHGVNYMPSSGIGTEDGDYFEQWIGPRAYDPEVIDRDLRRIRDMGMNSVSIFQYHQSMGAQNLIDLLRRLDQLGMKANLSLRPGTPLDFPWQQVKEMIERLRLRDNDTVFAYDLAWEPGFGNKVRDSLDAEWERWVMGRYGSIGNAEKDWQYPIPRSEDGKVTNVPDEKLLDGPWSRMTAAYRRFLDYLLYKRYSAARALVRGIDPNHAVSFRMNEAGNPTFRYTGFIPYDFAYLAAAVDIIEPEAYGRIGDKWESVKPGIYTYEYARWAAPGRPVMWAEAGVSAWDVSRGGVTPEKLKFQADYIRLFYRMLIESGADGVFFWWYPGGFRTGENSDFGIINPDGSGRAVTRVIRDHAGQYLNGPSARTVNHWLTMDRDRHPIGIGGVYDDTKEAFWAAVEKGLAPGLRTAGTGTTSADFPRLAVGNTRLDGTNPPKYLDAAFDRVEVKDHRGRWVRARDGDTVKVSADKPVVARIAITNLGETLWTVGRSLGAVYLVASGPAVTTTALPNPVPKFGEAVIENAQIAPGGLKARAEVTLGLVATDRSPFGERIKLVILPQ